MKILPRDSNKESGWGHTREPATSPCEIFSYPLNTHCHTLILQRPTKLLKPPHASLFYIIPLEILTDIDIWISILKHLNKFNHAISRFKSICNPVFFKIPHELWTPYHIFRAFRW